MTTSDGPFWLDPLASTARTSAVDRLWLRQPGLEMADALFPGFTNTTQRIRYYTVMAWILSVSQGDSDYQRLLETAFLQMQRQCSLKNGDWGGPGSEQIKARFAPLALTSNPPGALVSVFDAAQYGPSCYALEVGGRELLSLGRELVESLQIPAWAVPARGATSLTVAQAIALEPLALWNPPGLREKEVLVEILFRFNSKKPSHIQRRKSLGALLATIQSAKFCMLEELDFQHVMVKGLEKRDFSWLPDSLVGEGYGLGIQSLRAWFRYALETIWVCFGALVGAHPGGELEDYLTLIWDEFGAEGAWQPLDTLSVELLYANRNQIPKVLHRHGHAAVLAAQLLALVARIAAQLPAPAGVAAKFLREGNVDRVSLSHFGRQYQDSLSSKAWLERVLRRYVVVQHFHAAAHKLEDGKYAYHFLHNENGFSPVVTQWSPDGGRTKVGSAKKFFFDLGLLAPPSDIEPFWTLGADGQEILHRVIRSLPV